MKITLSSFFEPQPKKLEIKKYQYVPLDEQTGFKQGKKWDDFNKWKHLFENSTFTYVSLNFQEGKKALKEIKTANSQSPNKMRIWTDNNGDVRGIKQ